MTRKDFDRARINRWFTQWSTLVFIALTGEGMFGWRGAVLAIAAFFGGASAEAIEDPKEEDVK